MCFSSMMASNLRRQATVCAHGNRWTSGCARTRLRRAASATRITGYVKKTPGEATNHLELYAEMLPHAFTHWTYEHTLATASPGQEAMVYDIQGVGTMYTDVTVHTQSRKFGSTDLGTSPGTQTQHTALALLYELVS